MLSKTKYGCKVLRIQHEDPYKDLYVSPVLRPLASFYQHSGALFELWLAHRILLFTQTHCLYC